MDRGRDDSSVVLLSINDKPVGDNNNITEHTSFHKKMELLEEEPIKDRSDTLFKQPRLRIPVVITSIVVLVAVITIAVILIVKFAVPPSEVSSPLNQTTFPPIITKATPSTTISPTRSTSSISSVSSSTSHTLPTSSVSSSIEPSTPSHSSTSRTIGPTSEISTTSTVISTSVTHSPSSTISPTSSVTSSSTLTVTPTTPSITTSKTTPHSVCGSGRFQCSDATCIDNLQVCDGTIHCPDASDETKGCECSDDQFGCSSGQCVSNKYRCDGTPHCEDVSDEVNCSNCYGYQCASGLCTWNINSRCDDVIHCPDLSDEKWCGSKWGFSFCRNGLQVPANRWCDGIDDCFDNSDEQNCTDECSILAGKKWCADGRTCILRTWFCDGFPDCPNGTDEHRCARCTSDQLQCNDFSCVNQSRVCDGVSDCPSGLDERDCLTLMSGNDLSMSSGVVMVTTFDSKLPVCSDNWSKEVADEVCFYFGHGLSQRSDHVSLVTTGLTDTSQFMGVGDKSPDDIQSVLVRFDKVSTCTSGTVVRLTCTPKVCGERQVDYLTPFIVGGKLVAPGKWPWVASISRLGVNICGGVLLNENWVLTAAHCIVTNAKNYSQVPHYFHVTVGSIQRNISSNLNAQRRQVDRIVLHKDLSLLVSGMVHWDMALLHFNETVNFGDYVQPVCLPQQSQEYSVKSVCFLAGWGKVNPLDLTVNDLRDAKMKLWDESICRSNTMLGEKSVDTNSTICAGYATSVISACQGDSGGPLMCQDVRGRWTVVGVMSSGISNCDASPTHKADRYAKVSATTEWIESVIENR